MHLNLVNRFLPLALLLLMAVLIGAGCGQSDATKAEYRRGLIALQEDFATANEASQAASTATDQAVRSGHLEHAYEALDSAADTAERMRPPKDVRNDHEQLTEALRAYADLFRKLASLKQGDPRETELYSSAGEIVAKLDTANRALKQAGYDVADTRGTRN